jgi:hypothetical protein
MKTTSTRRTRIVKRLALGLAIAAVAAPAAQAGVTIPPELSGRQLSPTTGGGVVSELGAIPGQLEGRQFGPSSLPLVTMPEDLSGREFGPATFTSDLPVITPVADGFDWRDAGVGAAVAVAVSLLAAAALLIGRRRTLAGT